MAAMHVEDEVDDDEGLGVEEKKAAEQEEDEDMEDDVGISGAFVWALYSRKGGRKQWWPARVSLALSLPPLFHF